MYPFVFSFVNRHDCGLFMLQNYKTYHCRVDGVIEMLDYSHEDILDIRKTLMYTCATSDVFDVDFRGLFGIEPCTCAWTFVIFCTLYFSISTVMKYVFELMLCVDSFFLFFFR